MGQMVRKVQLCRLRSSSQNISRAAQSILDNSLVALLAFFYSFFLVVSSRWKRYFRFAIVVLTLLYSSLASPSSG